MPLCSECSSREGGGGQRAGLQGFTAFDWAKGPHAIAAGVVRAVYIEAKRAAFACERLKDVPTRNRVDAGPDDRQDLALAL